MLIAVFLVGCAGSRERENRRSARISRPWAAQLDREILAMGHGNWIVIAESSFPVHSRRGVRTLRIDAEIPDVLDQVVKTLEYSESTTPYFSTSRELDYISNDLAPGVEVYRSQLKTALRGHATRQMDYQALGMLLEDSANSFAVLVLKTHTSIPYSSIFVELRTSYWDLEGERNMRQKMKNKKSG